MSIATRNRVAATSTLVWTSDSALQSHVLGCDGVHLIGECYVSEFDRNAFQNESGDTVCRTCRGDYYGCDCPPRPARTFLSRGFAHETGDECFCTSCRAVV